MAARLILFFRLIIAPLTRERLRTGLTILAIGLGVGVVVAIDLAGQAAAGSFHSSLQSLTGKGDLLITATGGLDEKILGRLVSLPYAFDFTPRIEDFAAINGKGEAVPFIGLDLIGHNSDAISNLDQGSGPDLLKDGDAVWVGASLKLHAGQRVSLLINDQMRRFTVAGILQPRKNEINEQNVIVADIGLAQRVTEKIGKLDSIDVTVPAGGSIQFWQQLLRRQVPASVLIEPEGERTAENRKMLAAFRLNLRVLSYVALIVGAFLIYNTISISVIRRRNEIGVVRALGGTRMLVAGGFLCETLFFALIGSGLGLVIGRLMAVTAVKLIGNTVHALYISSQPAPVHLTWSAAAAGVGLGIAVSLIAALGPALEAARIAPVEAMARGCEEYTFTWRSNRLGLYAIVLLCVGALLAELPPLHGAPIFAYLSVLLLVAGTAAAIPATVIRFSATGTGLLRKLPGAAPLLAMRSLQASLGRTSILTAALATAVAMTASIAIMVGSFRETVQVWMNDQLEADFYLRPAGWTGPDQHPVMNPDIADQIERLPGVAAVERSRVYPFSYQGAPATLAGAETSSAENVNARLFLPGENRSEIFSKLQTGNYAVVSEPFAYKHRVHVGDTLHIPMAGETQNFTVLGIYYDYSAENGYVVVDRHTLLKYLPDQAESSLAVYLKRGAASDTLRKQIDQIITGRAVLIFPNRALRQAAIQIFDRTFRITYALEAVAVAVAVLGIAGALLAMVIDLRRDFALLRFLGGAKQQIRAIILSEAALLGLIATGIGVVLGIALSLILIFVINKQSFGWTIQFHWPVALVITALTGIYGATILAGLYPARMAIRMEPIEVIHEE
ncbi:MAG: ABC transporter permease [Acidobacteriaceae bacterium]|nr:ABC transporter permease [Acidobacteriaceae bacterium]MBV9500185.1 ABC transporter permease [Acidobacteriaceae bacterium]